MKLDFDEHETVKTITAYSTGGITVDGRVLTEPFVLCADTVTMDCLPRDVFDFGLESIARLVEFKQSIIIIGTGARQTLLPAHVLGAAYESGIGVEVMTTPAACRSYNVLVGENRAVVGAFYMM